MKLEKVRGVLVVEDALNSGGLGRAWRVRDVVSYLWRLTSRASHYTATATVTVTALAHIPHSSTDGLRNPQTQLPCYQLRGSLIFDTSPRHSLHIAGPSPPGP